MNYVYVSTCMKALCRHVKQNKQQGGLSDGLRGGLREVLEGNFKRMYKVGLAVRGLKGGLQGGA